jgi:hypothetical protein
VFKVFGYRGSPPVYCCEDMNEVGVGGWKYGVKGIRGEGIRRIRVMEIEVIE